MIPAPTLAPRQVELIRDLGGLADLESEWRRIAVGRGNAFLTPDWFHAWHRHYGADEEPFVGAVRDPDGRLRGLLPLTLSRRGLAPTARFAGSSLGDHFHPVAAAEDEADVAAVIADAIRASSPAPPTLVLENVDTEACWWRELARSLVGDALPIIDRESALPRARLAGLTWQDYLAGRSRNLRSQVRRRRKALEREHELDVHWAQADDVTPEIAELFRLHDARWDARSGTSSLISERARAFHADFARAAQREDWLRLCFLEIDGDRVAGWYGWRLGDRYAYYQAGFDPTWADHSVGFVLFAETIRHATEEGAAEYDMLLGDEPFKLRFADSKRMVCTVMIAPRLRPARLATMAERSLRRVGHRLPEGVREPLKRHARPLLDRMRLARRR